MLLQRARNTQNTGRSTQTIRLRHTMELRWFTVKTLSRNHLVNDWQQQEKLIGETPRVLLFQEWAVKLVLKEKES